jgi:hypothetical protein
VFHCLPYRSALTRQHYLAALVGDDVPAEGQLPPEAVDNEAENQAAAAAKYAAWQNRRNPKAPSTGLEPALQGSLLLQAITGLGKDEVFERSVG